MSAYVQWCAMAIAAVCVLPGSVMGQEMPAECKELDRLRDQPLREADDQILDACINAALARLNANAEDPAARVAFVNRMVSQHRHRDNTPAFRQRWTERINQRLKAVFTEQQQPPAGSVRAMAQLLARLESVQVYDALLAALNLDDAVARFHAARGLTGIRDDIGADARLTEQTLEAIAQVNMTERNGVVSAALYEAMNYEDTTHAERIRTQLLPLLDARLRRLAQGNASPDRAALKALELLRRLAPDAPNSFKSDVVLRLAVLLRLHVERYVQGGLDMYQRAAVEETILETEELLQDILDQRVSPSVNSAREKGGDAATLEMQIELNRWIGTEQAAGELNGAPWNVPVGAPIQAL